MTDGGCDRLRGRWGLVTLRRPIHHGPRATRAPVGATLEGGWWYGVAPYQPRVKPSPASGS